MSADGTVRCTAHGRVLCPQCVDDHGLPTRENTSPPPRRASRNALLPLLAVAAAAGAGVPPLHGESRPFCGHRTRREREESAAELARKLDGRVFQHRTTGEIRGVQWTPECIVFVDPRAKSRAKRVFRRPHRKALQWCQNADDITPPKTADVESEGGEL